MPVNPLNPDLYDPNIVGLHANYRFITTDLVTNDILADIPFKNVSYDRAIKSAGQFSGSIEVLPKVDRGNIFSNLDNTSSLDLYKTTMPGKTGLYVIRNTGADYNCVWGGIIWSRKYDIISRELQVSAAEFTSYFHHRVAWKTMNHMFSAKINSYSPGNTQVILYGYGEIDIRTGTNPTIKVGSWVKVEFYEIENFKYNGFYRVDEVIDQVTGTVFRINIPNLPIKEYTNVTIYLRANTIDYVKTLLDSTFVDFINIQFPNDEIEPAKGVDLQVGLTKVTNEVAEVFVYGKHGMIVGQTGVMYNMNDQDYNGTFVVSEVIGDNTFRYVAEGLPDKPQTAPWFRQVNISSRSLNNYKVTVTTSDPHNFTVGETVVINGLDDGKETVYIFDGEYQIYEVLSPTQFTYFCAGVYNKAEAAAPAGAKATVQPTLIAGTYGAFPFNSDIFLNVDADFEDGGQLDPIPLRGFQLRTIGDVLDKYSDGRNGFEYRVDCDYVPAEDYENQFSGRFTRTLVIIPTKLPNPVYNDGWLTADSFPGANKNVFAYPGNIEQFTLDESAEDVTTRFWVAGNIEDLGDDASQPYAAASAKDLLSPSSSILAEDPYATWPLLEAVESNNDVSDEDELYAQAERYLLETRPPVTKMTLSINGSLDPEVGTFKPGEWCSVLVDDVFISERIASPLEANREYLIRKIESIKVSVPNMPVFPEQVTIELIPEWEVDKRG